MGSSSGITKLGTHKVLFQDLCRGSAEGLDCGYLWWQSDKKTINPEAELQGLVYLFLTELPIVWLIIRSKNIYFQHKSQYGICTNMIVHNSLMQNRNRLKFRIYASYVNILIDAIER